MHFFRGYRPLDGLWMSGLALIYISLAYICLKYATYLNTITLIWLPSGVALAALLIKGKKYWPGITLGACTASIITGNTLLISIGISIGNTLEALLGAWLLTNITGFNNTLPRHRDFIGLLLLAGIISPSVAALNGVMILYGAGLLTAQALPYSILTWWMGDMLGIILLTSFILIWRQPFPFPRPYQRMIEVAALFGFNFLLGMVIFLAFLKPLVGNYAGNFLMFISVIWGALRFGPHITSLLIIMTLAMALVGELYGSAHFTNDMATSGMVNFWLYFAVLATIGMTLALTITELKHNDAVISENQRWLKSLIDKLPGYIYRVANDAEYTPEYISRYVENITGYNQDEYLVKRTISCGQEIHQEDKERIWNEVQNALNQKQPYECIYRILTKQGEIRWVWEHGQGVFDQMNELSHLEGFVMDITDRKQAETQIHQLNVELEQRVLERTAKLEAANNELESFTYTVSHDLRGPLRSIDGYSQALMEDCATKLDDKEYEYLARVRTATQHMGHLIDDLLNLSRVSRTRINPAIIDISAMCDEIMTSFRNMEPNRQLKFDIEPGLNCRGDPGLIRILFDNLLGNAWKYSRNREQSYISVKQIIHDNKQVFCISDNGAGFNMAYADKLFKAFQRLHSTKEYEGSGIGLATVERIIQRHNGRIWAESTLGQGASFYFTLGEIV